MGIIANFWILQLSDDSEYRGVLCGILIQARFTTAILFFNTMYFGFLFRTFLILHSDRGLVFHGQPYLKLFHKLFWIIFSAFSAIFYMAFPLSHQLKGKYPEMSKKGRMCLLLDIEEISASGHEGNKLRMINLIFPVVLGLSAVFLVWKVKRFLSGHWPRNRMSSIGVYRRNAITYRQTLLWLFGWCSSGITDVIMLAFIIQQRKDLSPKTAFWMWNIKGTFTDVVNLIVPSLILEITDQEPDRPDTVTDFYVRKPTVLEPRRPSQQEKTYGKVILVTEYQAKGATNIPSVSTSRNQINFR